MIEIPKRFFDFKYNGKAYPGAAECFKAEATCQHFCYEILRHFGYEIADFRSSELWEDREFTKVVEVGQEFDLALFSGTRNAYGAHVGLFVSKTDILHLSRRVEKPVIWSIDGFREHRGYEVLVGIKRPIRLRSSF